MRRVLFAAVTLLSLDATRLVLTEKEREAIDAICNGLQESILYESYLINPWECLSIRNLPEFVPYIDAYEAMNQMRVREYLPSGIVHHIFEKRHAFNQVCKKHKIIIPPKYKVAGFVPGRNPTFHREKVTINTETVTLCSDLHCVTVPRPNNGILYLRRHHFPHPEYKLQPERCTTGVMLGVPKIYRHTVKNLGYCIDEKSFTTDIESDPSSLEANTAVLHLGVGANEDDYPFYHISHELTHMHQAGIINFRSADPENSFVPDEQHNLFPVEDDLNKYYYLGKDALRITNLSGFVENFPNVTFNVRLSHVHPEPEGDHIPDYTRFISKTVYDFYCSGTIGENKMIGHKIYDRRINFRRKELIVFEVTDMDEKLYINIAYSCNHIGVVPQDSALNAHPEIGIAYQRAITGPFQMRYDWTPPYVSISPIRRNFTIHSKNNIESYGEHKLWYTIMQISRQNTFHLNHKDDDWKARRGNHDLNSIDMYTTSWFMEPFAIQQFDSSNLELLSNERTRAYSYVPKD